MSLLSGIENVFSKAEDAVQKLNDKVKLLFPQVSALETALAADVKAAYPMLTAELYSAIKQAANEALAAAAKTAPDIEGVLSGTETLGHAMSAFDTNLSALGLNASSLGATAKSLLLGASSICLKTFGPTIEAAVAGNPTSPAASQSGASSPASSSGSAAAPASPAKS